MIISENELMRLCERTAANFLSQKGGHYGTENFTGEHYIPYEDRTGEESVVYFTRDLSPEGLRKIYEGSSQRCKAV